MYQIISNRIWYKETEQGFGKKLITTCKDGLLIRLTFIFRRFGMRTKQVKKGSMWHYTALITTLLCAIVFLGCAGEDNGFYSTTDKRKFSISIHAGGYCDYFRLNAWNSFSVFRKLSRSQAALRGGFLFASVYQQILDIIEKKDNIRNRQNNRFYRWQ